MIIKCNQFEIVGAATGVEDQAMLEQCATRIMGLTGRPDVVIMGVGGAMALMEVGLVRITAATISKLTDVFGAGDAFTSALVSVPAAGAAPVEAGLLGNLSASRCISQLGSSGTTTPEHMMRHISHM